MGSVTRSSVALRVLVIAAVLATVQTVNGQSAVAETAPGPPTIGSVTALVGKISVAYSPPTSDGGAPIKSYQAACTSGDGGASGATSFSTHNPLAVPHLTPGATYQCTVVARNKAGVGIPSAPSAAVEVPNVPDPPTITNIAPSPKALSLSYDLGSTNGEPITGVKATCTPALAGTTKSKSFSLANPLTINVSPKGGTYTCTVIARNAVGRGQPSAPFVADGEPGLISDLSGTSFEDRQTTLTFTTPPDNGDPITAYNVSVDGTQLGAPLDADDTVPLPSNGQSYDVRIQPCNQHCGTWSNTTTVTPDAAPGTPPLSSSVAAGNVFNFSWGSPTSNGCALDAMAWSVDSSTGPWTTVSLQPGSTSVNGSYGESHTLYLQVSDDCGLVATASTTATSAAAYVFNNYGNATAGVPMCRGNPGFPNSNPGGSFSQTMTVPAGVGTINHVVIDIDPDSRVTATLTLYVNGTQRAHTSAAAAGDTNFSFPDVIVATGDSVAVSLVFSAMFGQIITIYETGNPGGTFSVTNHCANDPNETFSTTSTGVRATVSGWS